MDEMCDPLRKSTLKIRPIHFYKMDFVHLKCISVKLLQVGDGGFTAGGSVNRKNVSLNLMINSS